MPFSIAIATTLLLLIIIISSVTSVRNEDGEWGVPNNTLTVSGTDNQLYLIDIQNSYPNVDWSTLDRLYIDAGQYKFIRIGNLPNRNASRPLIITNINGQVRVGGLDHYYLMSISGGTNWILTGKYDPISMTGDSNFTGHGGGGGGDYASSQGTYGIYVDDEFRTFGTGNSGIGVASKVPMKPESNVSLIVPYPITSDFEISFVEVTKVGFAGFTIKTDNLNQTILNATGYTINNYTMNNLYIHDNYIHDIGSEGIYLGSTQSQSEQHAFNNLRISNNRILRTGTEGLQVGQLGDGCEIYNNVVALSAIDWKDSFQTYQDNSLQVTFRYGQSSVHHNVFIGAGDSIISFTALNAVGDVHSSGDVVSVHDNYLSSSRFLGMYMAQLDQPRSTTTQSIADGVTTYRFVNNTFREVVFGRDEIYVTTQPTEDLIRLNAKFTNPVELDGNILDSPGLDNLMLAKFAYSSKLGSSTDPNVTLNGFTGYITGDLIAEKEGLVGSGNVTASNNIRSPVQPVTFQNFLPGIPADVNYLSIERWVNISRLNWHQVHYHQGDYVLYRGNVYQSIENNTGVQPDLEDSCETWMLLPQPVDDVRLACGSAHQGIGLLDRIQTCSACTETGTSCVEDSDCCSGNCDNTGESCQEPPTYLCQVTTALPSKAPTSNPSSTPTRSPSKEPVTQAPTKSPITTSKATVYNKSPTATKTTITGTTSATETAVCTAADEAAARSECCVTQEQWKTTSGIMCTAANYTVGSGCEAEANNMQCAVTSRRRLVEGRGLLTTYTVKSTAELSVAITAYCEMCTEAQVATLTATVTAQVEKGVAEIDLTCPSGAIPSACSTTTTKVVVKNPLTLDIKRWYPLWKNNNANKNTCANDGNYEMYMLKNGFFKPSIEACCRTYFNWDYQACLVEAGGAAVETGKFYVDYIKKHCVQDCLEDGKTNMAAGACTNPGGNADTWKTLYADAKMCCKNKLWYLPAETCEAQSLGGSLTPVTYVGSGKWYMASDGKDCVQDCNENSGPQCEPTRGNWEHKYESSAACCKKHFNWLMEDKDACKTARTYTNDRRE